MPIATHHSRMDEPSCTVSSANNGAYNIGRLSGSLLKANANTGLNPINKIWAVTCDAETYLTFNAIDNRADTVSTLGVGHYGLGPVNGTGKIGFYKVIMKNATVDGVKTNVFSSNSSTFNALSSVPLNTSNRAHGWASGNSVQKSGLAFTAELEVTPTLGSVTMMNGPITDHTVVDGSMSLNFSFGI